MLELHHLQLLLSLRAHGSLAAAADALCVTPSAVSHKLKELERYYDVLLVNRRTRPLSFTPAGQTLLMLGEQVVPKIAKAEANLRQFCHGQSGHLRLASECHSCFDWLMPILARYRKSWQDVSLDFATAFEPNPYDLLTYHEADILITSSRTPIDGVAHLPLFSYESRLVVAPDHHLTTKPTIMPKDVARETLICYPVDTHRLDVVAHFLSPLTPSAVRHAELIAIIIQLVASGHGVAALPDWVVGEYEKKGWVVSRALGDGVHCQLYAAYLKDKESLAYVKGFLDILASGQAKF